MADHLKEKNLELDRLVFFSDAVVAIAITLLALDLKIEKVPGEHLTFADLGRSWEKFVAFFLSFLIIAVFWKVHHQFFSYIKKIDGKLLFFNMGWLLFIVMLPFATSLVSPDFGNGVAIFIYSTTIFAITCFQNMIWDYVAEKPEYLKDTLPEDTNREYRVACNLAMINAILAMIVSFFSPIIAFVILFTRTIMFRLSAIQYERRKKKKTEQIKRMQEANGRKKNTFPHN